MKGLRAGEAAAYASCRRRSQPHGRTPTKGYASCSKSSSVRLWAASRLQMISRPRLNERKPRYVMNEIPAYKFFIVSACAVRVRGSEVEVVHGNGRLIMPTREEAYELGLRQALDHYPVEDGWSRHDVVVNELLADDLKQALYALGENGPAHAAPDASSESVM